MAKITSTIEFGDGVRLCKLHSILYVIVLTLLG